MKTSLTTPESTYIEKLFCIKISVLGKKLYQYKQLNNDKNHKKIAKIRIPSFVSRRSRPLMAEVLLSASGNQ